MIASIIRFIRVLHSDRDPRQIAIGFALGLILGLTPIFSLHNLIVLLIILFFRVNIGAAILSWLVFSGVAYAVDPLSHQFGLLLLTGVGGLQGLWTTLYNAPIVPYTRFNNTVLMGSLIIALIALYPVYLGGRTMLVKYRETVVERLSRWKIVQVVKASSLYRWYMRYSELKG
jgi:uncharacterized protein (TIGR03546 family)